MEHSDFQICPLTLAHAEGLKRLFETLIERKLDHFFHPHPLTKAAADEIASYHGRDFYCVAAEGPNVLAYGMLRGWDAGYTIPSLGLAVHPDWQGRGLGRLLMQFLTFVAIQRGATKIRLSVHNQNKTAIALYQKLGYQLSQDDAEPKLIGFLDLVTGG